MRLRPSMQERFYHRPEMFYSPDKLVVVLRRAGAHAGVCVQCRSARRPLPTKDAIVADTVDSIAARFNLRYSEQKWLNATAELSPTIPQALAEVPARRHDYFQRQPVQLRSAAWRRSHNSQQRDAVFEALRQSIACPSICWHRQHEPSFKVNQQVHGSQWKRLPHCKLSVSRPWFEAGNGAAPRTAARAGADALGFDDRGMLAVVMALTSRPDFYKSMTTPRRSHDLARRVPPDTPAGDRCI